jgi:PAS domain S-box-containing protein
MQGHSMSDYMAHGFCFLWDPSLVWLHVISDIITGLAYYAIAIALFYFTVKRRDLPFLMMFVLFGLFILACGTTHLFSAYTVYVPEYWKEGVVKAFTAIISIVSAILLIPLIPKAIALPSLTKALEENKTLSGTLKRQVEELRIKDSAMASAINAIVMLDLNGNLTYVNEAFLNLWGYDRTDEVIGKPAAFFWEPQKSAFSILEILRSKGKWSGELTAQKKDGKSFIATVSANSVHGESGKPVCLMASVIDITEQRKLEDQLRHAQKMDAVGTLAGGVAHDFNNILSAIIGYAHLLLMKMKADDPLRVNVDEILGASERATTLVQSLLAFSRKQPINLTSLELNAMVKRFEKFLGRLLREDIEARIVCTNTPLPLIGDSGQLEQVLMNLSVNARDAMPGGGCLTIETGLFDLDEAFIKAHGYGKPGAYALLSVTDTGSGMDGATKERLFEPFFTTKEKGKGTGLGLAIVYGIVKKHDGFINVYSEPGQGSTFKIYLPIAQGDVDWKEQKDAVAVPVRGGTETILVAEDDAVLRKLSVTVLRQAGYAVIEAVDGEDAIAKFTANKDAIRLVILDGIMPKKNGKESYDAIKVLVPDIRAIFMSGYAEDIFTHNGFPKNEVAFILKPVSPNVFLEKVREVLDQQ